MEFQSWAEYAIFAEFVKCKARYVLDERSKRFLEVVLKTSGKRNRTLPQRSKLWRAQIGHGWRTEQVPSWAQADFGGATGYMMPHPFGCKRMLPQLDRATEGRANPTGIPCVYFAMEKETAMSEVRPWIGSHISLAIRAARNRPLRSGRVRCGRRSISPFLNLLLVAMTLQTTPQRNCLLRRFGNTATTVSFTKADSERVERMSPSLGSIVLRWFLAVSIRSRK